MDIQIITQELIDEVCASAKTNERLRQNYNFHRDINEPVNRLLNALEPNTYIRPHRHLSPPKIEAYIVLQGSLDVLIFDDLGNLTLRKNLSPKQGSFGIDIPSDVWHGLIVKEPNTVIYEVKSGPFSPVDANDYASWSPETNDHAGIELFFKKYA